MIYKLTQKEDKRWEYLFGYYLNEGYSEKQADIKAFNDLKKEFTRLKKLKKGDKIK